MKRLFSVILALTLAAGAGTATARNFDALGSLLGMASSSTGSFEPAPTRPQIDVGFSPNDGAEEMVLRVINSAQTSVRVAAYSFTSPTITQALISAKRRGVDVAVVADYENNFGGSCRSRGRCAGEHAIGSLVNAGIPVRVISKYSIFHHKFVCTDNKHLELGSFNYSAAANSKNAENANVLWNHPEVAKKYATKWNQYWNEGQEPPLRY